MSNYYVPDPDDPANVLIELLNEKKLPDPVDFRYRLEPDKLDELRDLARAGSQRMIEIIELTLQAKLGRLGPRRFKDPSSDG